MIYRTQSWKFSEYKQIMEEKKLLSEIEREGPGEFIAKRISANPNLKKKFVVVLASLMLTSSRIANALGDPKTTQEVEQALAKVDRAGGLLVYVARRIGYWVCLIFMFIEIIRSLAQGDTSQIGKIIMKYAMALMGTFVGVWLLDFIIAIFS